MAAVTVTALIVGMAGGSHALLSDIASLAATSDPSQSTSGRGGDEYNVYFAIPGAIQFTDGFGVPGAAARPWTTLTILSSTLALGAIGVSPVFHTWMCGAAAGRRFIPRGVWIGIAAAGTILLPFAVIGGVGQRLFDVFPAIAPTPGALGLMEQMTSGDVAQLILRLTDGAPALAMLLGLGFIAALQSAAAFLLIGGVAVCIGGEPPAGGTPDATGHSTLVTRLLVVLLAVAAEFYATISPGGSTIAANLALAWGAQLLVPFAALCWIPWLTRSGVAAGLCAGIGAGFLTDLSGVQSLATIGLAPWRAWPFSVHPALWGLAVNAVICILVSVQTQDDDARRHRAEYHRRLTEANVTPAERRDLVIPAWAAVVAWIFLAVGPGAVIGNDIFGSPNQGREFWFFVLPPLLTWQFAMWGLGLLLLWFLGARLGLAKIAADELPPDNPVDATPADDRSES